MYLNPLLQRDDRIIDEVKQIASMEDRSMVEALIEENYAPRVIQEYLEKRGVKVSSAAVAAFRFLYLKSKEDGIPIEELLGKDFGSVVRSASFGARLLEEISNLWSDIDALNRIIKEGTDLVIATHDISARDVINAVNVKSHILARSNDRLVQYVAELTRALERTLDIVREVVPPEYLEIIQRRLEEEFGA